MWVPPRKRSKYIFRPYVSTGDILFHVLDISKRIKSCVVSNVRGGGCTVTNCGLWTICVFRVMTFKKPEMTFKASKYLLIRSFDYFLLFSILHDYIDLKYKHFQKSPGVFRITTFKKLDMPCRASEKNDTLFYFVQYFFFKLNISVNNAIPTEPHLLIYDPTPNVIT